MRARGVGLPRLLAVVQSKSTQFDFSWRHDQVGLAGLSRSLRRPNFSRRLHSELNLGSRLDLCLVLSF